MVKPFWNRKGFFYVMESETNSFISYVLTLLGGGSLVAVFNYLLGIRKSNTEDRKVDLQMGSAKVDSIEKLQLIWEREFARLEANIKDAHQELGRRESIITNLEKHVKDLEDRITALISSNPQLPIPTWRKSTDGTMLGLNEAYERAFLAPKGFTASDYVGCKDEKIWGKKISDHFHKHDKEALDNHESQWPIVFEEVDDDHLLDDWVFLKYPEEKDGLITAICGIGVPKIDYKKEVA